MKAIEWTLGTAIALVIAVGVVVAGFFAWVHFTTPPPAIQRAAFLLDLDYEREGELRRVLADFARVERFAPPREINVAVVPIEIVGENAPRRVAECGPASSIGLWFDHADGTRLTASNGTDWVPCVRRSTQTTRITLTVSTPEDSSRDWRSVAAGLRTMLEGAFPGRLTER